MQIELAVVKAEKTGVKAGTFTGGKDGSAVDAQFAYTITARGRVNEDPAVKVADDTAHRQVVVRIGQRDEIAKLVQALFHVALHRQGGGLAVKASRALSAGNLGDSLRGLDGDGMQAGIGGHGQGLFFRHQYRTSANSVNSVDVMKHAKASSNNIVGRLERA